MTSRRQILTLTAAGLVAGAALGAQRSTARAVRSFDPQEWIEEQEDFLVSKAVPSGALRGPTDDQLQPYFSNWAAQGLAAANTPRSREILGNFLEWFLAHVNSAEGDPYGIPGTVSDWHYDEETGDETDTGKYSSTDAGTTVPLIAAHDAYRTGDRDLQHLVIENLPTYEMMAQATTELVWGVRNPDHLCWARPDSKMKYVQDHAVVYRGLSCLAWLERRAGRLHQAKFYDRSARQTRAAMIDILWNAELQNWSWGHGEKLLKVSDPKAAFMADAWCQYWQVQLGVLGPRDPRSVAAWRAFTEAWPGWMHNEIDNDFPHTEMAVSAVLMGEPRNAATLLQTCREKFAGNGWALPWYHGEAGHSIRAARLMIKLTERYS